MNTMSKKAPERHDIEALLPWHAAGTLNRRDAERVEQALANDNELARHYALVREELGETIRLNETLGAPSARALDRLFAKIDAEPPKARAHSFNLTGWLTQYVSGFSTRTLAWSGAVAAVAIVLQAGVLTTVILKDHPIDGDTKLASFGGSSDSSLAVIRFAPQANSTEITNFLNAHKVSIVDGPRQGGMYRVRIAVPALPKEQLATVVKQMQDESKVVSFIAVVE